MTKKFIKVLCFSCICLLAAACGEKENVYFQSETSVAETQRSEAVPETDDTQISEESGIQTEKCFVYICGAVNTPGVYEVTQNARLYEVIEAAGGLTEDAAEESVNQAREIVDGEMYYGNGLCESVTANEDASEFTLKLKDGLKWHDGQPITADDVVFTMQVLVDEITFSDILHAVINMLRNTVNLAQSAKKSCGR